MSDQNAQISWRDGHVPVSTRFDDPYFSLEDGAAETAYVFLAGNDLPQRFRPGFHIAELGFGTGLNLLALLAALPEPPPGVGFTTFEAAPRCPAAFTRPDIRCPAQHFTRRLAALRTKGPFAAV